MKVDVLLGLQWGDEGKGKIVDVLTPNYDVIARFQGGPNAGHTIEFEGKKFILHTIPSGIFNPQSINIIGNGVIVDPYIFSRELKNLSDNDIPYKDNLFISRKAHMILPSHRLLDATYEASKGKEKIGSTLKGIGPSYSDKISRTGIRVGDLAKPGFRAKYDALKAKHLDIINYYGFDYSDYKIDGLLFDEYEKHWFEAVDQLNQMNLIDSEYYINQCLKDGKKVLAEGAQGSLLDIDFGSYPFVTSSNTICAGVCSGLGVAPKHIGKVIGIFKAYCTRVGSGPFPSELFDDNGQKLRDIGREYGSTTGRPRRCGWLDMVSLNYSIMLNGVDELMMMKTDVLNAFDELNVCTSYQYKGETIEHLPFEITPDLIEPNYTKVKGWNEDLSSMDSYNASPNALKSYVDFIEEKTGVPVKIVSIGPDRSETLFR